MILDMEEEIVEEETEETWNELLEDDEISPEEEAFMQGWLEAGRSMKRKCIERIV